MTGAGICANQLSIGGDRDVVYKKIKEKGGLSKQDAVSNSIFKRRGEKKQRVPN